jgi:hypothetical protein
LFLLLSVGWVPAIVLYSPALLAEPSAAEKETARSLMDEGDRLLAKGELTGALKRYQAAHQIMGVPTTGIEVAQVQERLGLLVEARATAIEVTHSAVSPKEAKVFAEARASASELAESLEARIASISIDIEPANVDSTTKVGAAVVPQAAMGLPYRVNPGKHVLSVTAPGYVAQEVKFQVAEGEQRALRVVLVKDNAMPQGPAGEEPTKQVPDVAAKPVTKRDNPSASTASDGSWSTRTWVAFGVAAGTGLVGGGAGVYSLLLTNDAKDSCDGNVCPIGVQDDLDTAKTMAWVANIGLGVAVLSAGYGVYSLLTDSADSETLATSRSKQTQQSGWLASGQVGVAVSPRGDSGTLTWTGAF